MSYLYLIIPPIVIVLSLALLIYLISRRIPAIDETERNIKRGEENGLGSVNKITKKTEITLNVLEKVTSWFKIFSLKFHNISDRWQKSIKDKKKANGDGKKIVDEESAMRNIKNAVEKNEEAKNKEVEEKAGKIGRFFSSGFKKDEKEKIEKAELSREPMISKKIILPEVEEKNEMEEELIKRIAVNPKDIEAYERLGDYYLNQKNLQDAKDCYRQVMKLSPGSRTVRLKMRKIERGLVR